MGLESCIAQVHVDVELGFGRASLSPVCFGDRSGTALAVSPADPERRVYVLDIDLQTFAVSAIKVEGWIRNFNYMTAAPFEINCAMFFVSRLGVNKLSPSFFYAVCNFCYHHFKFTIILY